MSRRGRTNAAILLVGIALSAAGVVAFDSDDEPRSDGVVGPATQAVVEQANDAQTAIDHAEAAAQRAIEAADQPAPHGVYVLRAIEDPAQRRMMLRGCSVANRRTATMCEAVVAIALGELDPGTYKPAALEAKLSRVRPLPTATELLGATANTVCFEKMMDALKEGRVREGQDPYSYPDDLLPCVG